MIKFILNRKLFDWFQDFRYILLLIAYFLVLWVPIIFQAFGLDQQLTDISLFVLILAIFNFIRKNSVYTKVFSFVSLVIISGRGAAVGTENENISVISWVLMLVYFIFFLRILLIEVWNAKKVNMNTILGAIAGYVQIGVIAFILFKVLDILLNNHAFTTTVSISDLIYFSFVTLTTVGYGDITPASDEVKAFSVIFAMVGQFYMAILMALLVGKYQQEHSKQ
ncbi:MULTISPECIES: potassium channel family protein [Flammeovirga]|uniref:Two pore domain potassium channel family protein n=1 Tax=Flammeovirga agarivorans TaxID=2726742 RepID=A0A7X8SI64_9BACT|nr:MULTISPECIES: potassium channel family protein [Flammeovirga]NLR90582.1 two pore domain potassium channel family protein [Flammeovirga agarivorans]